jgi:hypothetical protein
MVKSKRPPEGFRVKRWWIDRGRRSGGVEAISSILSTLPILAPDLFGEFASRKNRIQNDCEQDYPTPCRHD